MGVESKEKLACDDAVAECVAHEEFHRIEPAAKRAQTNRSVPIRNPYSHIEWLTAASKARRSSGRCIRSLEIIGAPPMPTICREFRSPSLTRIDSIIPRSFT